MLNHIYKLISPGVISVEFEDVSIKDNVIVRPKYMAVCHADQRYYQGQRNLAVLKEKLPMALIHECSGIVEHDPSGTFQPGCKVVLIPNVPPQDFPKDLYENYVTGSGFSSSSRDGFMKELIYISPQRLVDCNDIPSRIAAVTEFVSVAVHAIKRFDKISHMYRKRIGIWGDGSMAYVVSNVLSSIFKESEIIVVGKHRQKLAQFSFVKESYLFDDVNENLKVDHAFECCGGVGSISAVDQIVSNINPQGTILMMGVSENPIPINTRLILEKGLIIVGCSRSGREDFVDAIELIKQNGFQRRLKAILSMDDPVRSIEDIHRVFRNDLSTSFKTVFKWEV